MRKQREDDDDDDDSDGVEKRPDLAALRSESESGSDEDDDNESEQKKTKPDLATVRQVFSFARSRQTKLCLAGGFVCAVISGAVFPAIAFYYSRAFRDLSRDTSSDAFMSSIESIAYTFMILGAIIFVTMTVGSMLMEMAAGDMTREMKTSWFRALLRQDMAYFDIKNVSSEQATIISTNGIKYRKGVGLKLAETAQFTVSFVGALAFSFWSEWRVCLMILLVAPIIFLTLVAVIKLNTTQTKRAHEAYAKAGAIVLTAISSIRTILALNAVEKMIGLYQDATAQACQDAVRNIWMLGLAKGAQMACMLLNYIVVTLFGSWLLYSNVESTGCDPSGTVEGVETCDPAGVGVFGAFMGVHIAAAMLPQVSVALEAFTGARVACYPAIEIMSRTVEDDQDEDYMADGDIELGDSGDSELPKYKIDSSSDKGKKLSIVTGDIEFRNVGFAYPARRGASIFQDFSLQIPAGKTIALCGASGCGKSSVVQLIERFYDPTSGSITLDGVDLRELNVKCLREQIGLVLQEPKLFRKSIRENISLGAPHVTQEGIEEAARMANAHDFIMSFPDGYDTQVGDLGNQLSGGQKQRICIARILVRKPRILLLDEATSALDSESEALVQQALDRLMKLEGSTFLVIAHRLSTIKNADTIAVVFDGKIAESGTHEELLSMRGHYYDLVEAQKTKTSHQSDLPEEEPSMENGESRHESAVNSIAHFDGIGSVPAAIRFRNVHFRYPARPDIDVFRGLNLSVRHGETLGLVGPSGCGKSTTVQLIECFYRPTEGTIEYNGVDMKDMNVRWLRDQLGLVSQEASLFATTIEENIRYGCPEATKDQIVEAAKQANCHDFIEEFPEGYQTRVGEGSSLVSGGEKQRIAIARALLKKPKVLLLDEATSALDSENENIVQAALDKIMATKDQTCIVIAHRLSTIRNADRIAVIDKGKVQEIGTHDELMSKANGQYRRLQELQNLDLRTKKKAAQDTSSSDDAKKDSQVREKQAARYEQVSGNHEMTKEDASRHSKRIRIIAFEDKYYLVLGAIGAVFAGFMFPAWGWMFASMVELIYTRVEKCPPYFGGFVGDCPAYYDSVARDMQHTSLLLLYGYLGLMACTLMGNVLLYYGFGSASERMNKRVRDAAFANLLRQEVSWFDLRSPGMIASQLSDDAALLHAFSGEPIRMLVLNLSSVLVGVVIAFVYMWPFALLTLALIPFLAFGAQMKIRFFLGEDEIESESLDENSPGGILIETLSNMRTVASLTLECKCSAEYDDALRQQDQNPLTTNLVKGGAAGTGQFIQLWCFALMFWWGGWLLWKYPDSFTFHDFLVSMFALFLSIMGLAFAAEGAIDRDKAKEAASRVFELTDRQSEIDPLSDEGKKDV